MPTRDDSAAEEAMEFEPVAPLASRWSTVQARLKQVTPLIRSLLGNSDGAGLATFGVSWFFVGWCLATATPWLEPAPFLLSWLIDLTHVALPWITFTLIVGIAVVSFRIFGRTGEALCVLPLTLVQIMLFTLLFFQVSSHWGASHYSWDEAPGTASWFVFSGIHALRASDIADLMHAYGLRLQSVHHQSVILGCFLLVYHVIVEFLFVGLAMKVLQPIFDWWEKNLNRDRIPEVLRAVVVFLVLSVLCGGLFRSWTWLDLFMLVPDSVIRVVDAPDALELFHLRLHGLPHSWFEGSIMAMLRLLVALRIGQWLASSYRTISLTRLNGFGLSREDLEDTLRASSNAACVELAQKRLEALNAFHPPEIGRRNLIRFRWNQLAVMAGTAAAGLLVAMAFRDWGGAAERLAEVGVTPDHPRAVRALGAIKYLGTNGSSSGPLLQEAAKHPKVFSPDQYRGIIAARVGIEDFVMRSGSNYKPFPEFAKLWRETPPYHVRANLPRNPLEGVDMSLFFIEEIQKTGPRGATLLYTLAYTESLSRSKETEEVRLKARKALQSLGPEAAQVLIDHALPANTMSSDYHKMMDVIAGLDRYWFTRTTKNWAFNPRYRPTPRK